MVNKKKIFATISRDIQRPFEELLSIFSSTYKVGKFGVMSLFILAKLGLREHHIKLIFYAAKSTDHWWWSKFWDSIKSVPMSNLSKEIDDWIHSLIEQLDHESVLRDVFSKEEVLEFEKQLRS